MTEILRRLIRTPQGQLGLLIVGLVLIVVIAGPSIAPHNPESLAPLSGRRV